MLSGQNPQDTNLDTDILAALGSPAPEGAAAAQAVVAPAPVQPEETEEAALAREVAASRKRRKAAEAEAAAAKAAAEAAAAPAPTAQPQKADTDERLSEEYKAKRRASLESTREEIARQRKEDEAAAKAELERAAAALNTQIAQNNSAPSVAVTVVATDAAAVTGQSQADAPQSDAASLLSVGAASVSSDDGRPAVSLQNAPTGRPERVVVSETDAQLALDGSSTPSNALHPVQRAVGHFLGPKQVFAQIGTFLEHIDFVSSNAFVSETELFTGGRVNFGPVMGGISYDLNNNVAGAVLYALGNERDPLATLRARGNGNAFYGVLDKAARFAITNAAGATLGFCVAYKLIHGPAADVFGLSRFASTNPADKILGAFIFANWGGALQATSNFALEAIWPTRTGSMDRNYGLPKRRRQVLQALQYLFFLGERSLGAGMTSGILNMWLQALGATNPLTFATMMLLSDATLQGYGHVLNVPNPFNNVKPACGPVVEQENSDGSYTRLDGVVVQSAADESKQQIVAAATQTRNPCATTTWRVMAGAVLMGVGYATLLATEAMNNFAFGRQEEEEKSFARRVVPGVAAVTTVAVAGSLLRNYGTTAAARVGRGFTSCGEKLSSCLGFFSRRSAAASAPARQQLLGLDQQAPTSRSVSPVRSRSTS